VDVLIELIHRHAGKIRTGHAGSAQQHRRGAAA
jgi:hypothetical protein